MRSRFCTLCTILIVLSSTLLFAATPTMINFQGKLTNGAGTSVADGSYTVVFSIYSVPSGGSAIWTETQSVTTSGGLFTILLGSTTPVTDAVFSGTARYLAIKVGADPEMTPREELVSIPYALRVSTVDSATGGTIIGNINLDPSTVSTGNILKGGISFLHNFGTNNTFLGLNAGNLTMTGSDNTTCGFFALRNNTVGNANTASGSFALQNNTTGDVNTANGYYALISNTTGTGNTAIGVAALEDNTTGTYNTASGYNTLKSNTTGSLNTAAGWAALYGNTAGENNTAIGTSALLNNDSGNNNTAIGVEALPSNTTGSSNTAIGANTLSINNGSNNTANGWHALYLNRTGENNTACGVNALAANKYGHYNTAVGYGADVADDNFENITAIGNGAIVDASNKIRLGNNSVTVIEGQVAYTFTSDENQKENFQPIDGDDVLYKIRGLSHTSWNYKGQDPQQFRHYGPMAQEFFAAFGHDGKGTSGTPTTINSGDMAGVMLIAIQTLGKENEQMKHENTELKERLEALEAKMNRLLTSK